MREITYRQALNEALAEEMERDERVFIMGEDVAIYGGAYGVTTGLWERFGDERVRDTAISEQVITGAAVGAAMTGLRPVAEIMYVDFLTLAMDQLVNQAAKIRYMFGGKATVPMVLRTQGGAGRCLAGHHSQSLEAWFLHVPGLKVVMPGTPYDAKGLLKASIRDDNPVLFIEHKMLYSAKGEVPEGEYLVPLGRSEVKRPGRDVTILAYSRMLLFALKAAESLAKEEGIEAEVIDPRTLAPMDMEPILESIRKTGRLVTVEEGCLTGGVGAEVAARVMSEAFDYLDAPVVRVAAADVPIPMSEPMERLAVPDPQRIAAAARALARNQVA
ncbi:MAG: alpha-ketoacid dehydrogenase subunit beta [Patescibacteria group bacterium]